MSASAYRSRRRSGYAALVLAAALFAGPLQGEALAAKDVITVDLVNEPSSLDPHVQWNPDSYFVYRNIFDNLVTRDDKGTIVPQVAAAWKYLSDTEVEFTLQSGIAFHDGSPLTAEDVAFSVSRITDKAFNSPQLGQFNKIVKAEATGPNTVKLTTDGPYPVLLAQLVKLSIVPKKVVEAMGKEQFNLKPVGSGPYKFESWQRGVGVTLVRNDAYWGAKGGFAKALFRPVPDAATRLANLQAGASDLGVSLDPDIAAQLKTSAKAKPLVVLSERVAYVRLNPMRAPLDNPKLRLAIAHAIDKQAITEGLLGGNDKPVDQFLSPVHVGWAEGFQGPKYDPALAKKLIAEIGPAAKQRFNFATAPVYDQRVVQAVQQMLTDVGLNVDIEMTDMATWLQRAQGDQKAAPYIFFGRWSCACQDADGILAPLLESTSAWSAVRDPAIDALLAKARSTLDTKQRLEAYAGVHKLVGEQVPLVPLYQAAIIYGAAKPLEFTPTPNESMFLNRMSWKD
jgi:peptide/nickel transport system substrate-binding protein